MRQYEIKEQLQLTGEVLGDKRPCLAGPFFVVVNQQHHLCPDYFTEDSVPHIKVNAWFTSHVSREAVQKGWADFVPNHFSEVPRLLREYWPVDVAATVVSPMDEYGFFTCSLSVGYTMEAVKKAGKVVVQVNPHPPRTHGNCHIHTSEVDHIIECDEPLKEMDIPDISPVEEAIGGYIAEHVADGSTAGAAYPMWSAGRCSTRRIWGYTPN